MKHVAINEAINLKNNQYVATIGYFDGVHLGHQNLIKQIVNLAKKMKQKSLVITFDYPPKQYIQNYEYKMITPYFEKAAKIKALGVDEVIILKVNHQLITTSAFNFIKWLQNSFNLTNIIVGADFKFGEGLTGTTEILKTYFPTTIAEFVKSENHKISSSIIIDKIENGQINEANHDLGYNYAITSQVVHGGKLARQIGFPTANFKTDLQYIIPQFGVYETKTTIDKKKYSSITNVGIKPTFSNEKAIIETHILNFNNNLYGQKIKVEFIKKLRDEKKFANIEALKSQIKKDIILLKEETNGN